MQLRNIYYREHKNNVTILWIDCQHKDDMHYVGIINLLETYIQQGLAGLKRYRHLGFHIQIPETHHMSKELH